MIKSYKLLAPLLLLGQLASAQVWEHTQEWDEDWETKFSDWVASEEVHNELFHSKDSRYYGVKVDCADVIYVLRAAFSYENKLPYTVKNPVYRQGRSRYKVWTNDLKKWNRYEAGDKRFVAFARFLGASLGSETLMFNDTYPVNVARTRAGDMFGQKYKNPKTGSWLRHVYQVKGINKIGHFDLLYSNQQRAKDDKPMNTLKNFSLSYSPTIKYWGFKRFRQPEQIGLKIKDLTDVQDFSLEQYTKAADLTPKKFFEWVRSLLKTADETPNELVARHLKLLCDKSVERVEIVQGAVDYKTRTNNKCMNYSDYDVYSTPSRDGRLKKAFETFAADYQLLDDRGDITQITPELANIAESILKQDSWSEEESAALKEYCQIDYGNEDDILHLGDLNQRFQAGLVSSHPNDELNARWGVQDEKRTQCKVWY
jgi:hypothetical protein